MQQELVLVTTLGQRLQTQELLQLLDIRHAHCFVQRAIHNRYDMLRPQALHKLNDLRVRAVIRVGNAEHVRVEGDRLVWLELLAFHACHDQCRRFDENLDLASRVEGGHGAVCLVAALPANLVHADERRCRGSRVAFGDKIACGQAERIDESTVALLAYQNLGLEVLGKLGQDLLFAQSLELYVDYALLVVLFAAFVNDTNDLRHGLLACGHCRKNRIEIRVVEVADVDFLFAQRRVHKHRWVVPEIACCQNYAEISFKKNFFLY